MTATPLVSVIVPARNEAASIVDALRHITQQSYPLDAIEVLVVDGGSDDGTGEIVKEFLGQYAFRRSEVVVNPIGSTPSNLNVGLRAALGSYICRVDARSNIPPTYIETCVTILRQRPEIAVVGGAQLAVPPVDTPTGVGIARALNNPYGMGGSRYRRNAKSGFADTVYLGFFRSDELRQVGGWNEAFGTNQDFELNRRLDEQVGRIWFEDSIPVSYIPRKSISLLFEQYRRFGSWKVRYWRETNSRPEPRQWVLIIAPPVALAVAVAAAAGIRRDVTRTPLAIAVGFAAVSALELAATSPEPTGVRSRIAQLLSLAAVGLGWEIGVLGALLRRR